MGKTAFCHVHGHERGHHAGDIPVAVYSLEMSKEQLMQRMLAAWGKGGSFPGCAGHPSLDDNDWQNLYQAAGCRLARAIYIDDLRAFPPRTAQPLAEGCKRKKKAWDLVVVDYLQLMRKPQRQIPRTGNIGYLTPSRGPAKN